MPSLPQRKSYDIDHMFSYRSPGEHLPQFEGVRAAARILAEVIVENTPAGPDQDDALRHVRKAMLMAREAIELEGDLHQCDVLARKLAERVFAPVEGKARIREVRMNQVDIGKLVGHAQFVRTADLKAEGVVGHIWGAQVTAAPDVPLGYVVTVSEDSEEGGVLTPDAVPLT